MRPGKMKGKVNGFAGLAQGLLAIPDPNLLANLISTRSRDVRRPSTAALPTQPTTACDGARTADVGHGEPQRPVKPKPANTSDFVNAICDSAVLWLITILGARSVEHYCRHKVQFPDNYAVLTSCLDFC